MTAGRTRGAAAIALVAVTAVAGCTTTIDGAPRPGAVPVTTSSVPAEPTTGATSTSTSTPVNPTPEGSTSESAIRPMPPLDVTRDQAGGQAPPSEPAHTPTGSDPSVIGPVDIGDVLAQLDAHGFAVVDSSADPDTIGYLVSRSTEEGLALQVVSVGAEISAVQTSDLADALYDRVDSTILVLGPRLVSARGDQLSAIDSNDAVEAASDQPTDELATMTFINVALDRLGLAAQVSLPSDETEIVGGIDVAAIMRVLVSQRIAISPGATEVTVADFDAAVKTAWDNGLLFRVVVLSRDATGPLTDVASAVMHHTGGTVLILSPTRYALASATLPDSELKRALDAGADAATYSDFTEAVVDSLIG